MPSDKDKEKRSGAEWRMVRRHARKAELETIDIFDADIHALRLRIAHIQGKRRDLIRKIYARGYLREKKEKRTR